LKKRYGLITTIGKKTKIRFSKQIEKTKNEKLNMILPANKAEPTPSSILSTTLIMKKQDPNDFCDNFNEQSNIYTTGTMLPVVLYLSAGNLLFEIGKPTLISLTNLIFNTRKQILEYKMPSRQEIIQTAINFAAIKIKTEALFTNQILKFTRTFFGLLRSCRVETDAQGYSAPFCYNMQYSRSNFFSNKRKIIPEMFHIYKSYILSLSYRPFSEIKKTEYILSALLKEKDSIDIKNLLKNKLELEDNLYYDDIITYFYSFFNGNMQTNPIFSAYIILAKFLESRNMSENDLEFLEDDYIDAF